MIKINKTDIDSCLIIETSKYNYAGTIFIDDYVRVYFGTDCSFEKNEIIELAEAIKNIDYIDLNKKDK